MEEQGRDAADVSSTNCAANVGEGGAAHMASHKTLSLILKAVARGSTEMFPLQDALSKTDFSESDVAGVTWPNGYGKSSFGVIVRALQGLNLGQNVAIGTLGGNVTQLAKWVKVLTSLTFRGKKNIEVLTCFTTTACKQAKTSDVHPTEVRTFHEKVRKPDTLGVIICPFASFTKLEVMKAHSSISCIIVDEAQAQNQQFLHKTFQGKTLTSGRNVTLFTSEWSKAKLAEFVAKLECPKSLKTLFVGTEEHLIVSKDGKRGATGGSDVKKTVYGMSDLGIEDTLRPFLDKSEIALMVSGVGETQEFFTKLCKIMEKLDPGRAMFLVNSSIRGQKEHLAAIGQGRKILLLAKAKGALNGNNDFDMNAPEQATVFYGAMPKESAVQLAHWCRILGRGGRGTRKHATLVVSVGNRDIPTVKSLTESAGCTYGGPYTVR